MPTTPLAVEAQEKRKRVGQERTAVHWKNQRERQTISLRGSTPTVMKGKVVGKWYNGGTPREALPWVLRLRDEPCVSTALGRCSLRSLADLRHATLGQHTYHVEALLQLFPTYMLR